MVAVAPKAFAGRKCNNNGIIRKRRRRRDRARQLSSRGRVVPSEREGKEQDEREPHVGFMAPVLANQVRRWFTSLWIYHGSIATHSNSSTVTICITIINFLHLGVIKK